MGVKSINKLPKKRSDVCKDAYGVSGKEFGEYYLIPRAMAAGGVDHDNISRFYEFILDRYSDTPATVEAIKESKEHVLKRAA